MSIEILQQPLVRLRLNGLLETMEMRLEQARQQGLAHLEFLQLLLQDEIVRRDANALSKRLNRAKFEANQTFENMLLEHYPAKIQQRIRELQTNHYVQQHKHIIIMGPTGTGKTHLAQSLGHVSCCQGHTTRFVRANAFFRELEASRADNSWQVTFKKYLTPKLLILDDFGLTSLTPQQADDIYELIAERAGKGSFILTSNRTVDGWVKLFPDPVMANAALDRLANNAYQLILVGESYRKKMAPSMEKVAA